MPTVVRTGEWPFEHGSKVIERRKSSNAFKGFEVAWANALREALGSAVDPKEMPNVHTRVNDSTVGKKIYSIDINAVDDHYIQRWTGKWPFEPDSSSSKIVSTMTGIFNQYDLAVWRMLF